MRQRRAKTYRKLMSLYSMSFGFRQPYQVLVDAEMCRLAIVAKTNLQQQLSVVLQGTVKPMITQCCIHELYLQGKPQQAAVDLAKLFERRKCNHKEAIPVDECIASIVGKPLKFSVDACRPYTDASAGDSNKHRYVVATQLKALRIQLRLIPAVPIVHINRAVMILEPPSEATLTSKQQNEEETFRPSAAELATVKAGNSAEPPRRRKGPKGPNPLSVKRKAVSSAGQPMSRPSNADQKRKCPDVDDPTAPAARNRKRRRRHSRGLVDDHTSQTLVPT